MNINKMALEDIELHKNNESEIGRFNYDLNCEVFV
jgi:hypothetical protein